MADKDAGTPRVFLARHGLPILDSTAVPYAKTLYRSDRVEHEREVDSFSNVFAQTLREVLTNYDTVLQVDWYHGPTSYYSWRSSSYKISAPADWPWQVYFSECSLGSFA